MDMNELLRQHQIALIRRDTAAANDTSSDDGMVAHYRCRIRALQRELGVEPFGTTL